MSKYKTYSYPHVGISVTAKEHVTAAAEAADTTVLFVPFVSERGPIKTVKKIHSLEEFQSTYGEIANYVDRLGKHTAFNIMNWLTAGGTIYAYRLSNENATKATFSNGNYSITAKEYGDYLNDYSIKVQKSGNDSLYVSLINSLGNTIERIYVTGAEAGKSLSLASEYLESITITNISSESQTLKPVKGQEGEATDGIGDLYISALRYFWGTSTALVSDDTVDSGIGVSTGTEKLTSATAKDVLGNPLEYQIDLIMDAGYPSDIKLAMMKFISDYDKEGSERGANDQPVRDDIRGVFEIYESNKDSYTCDQTKTQITEYNKDPNIFVFSQDVTITDGIFDNKQVTVGPTYFLSSLIPANDIDNGIQFPVAGTRRAELEGIVSLSWNPMPEEKQTLFDNRINYIEKDSRGYYFMGNRTMEKANSKDNNTALTFMNNSRVVCRMVHELELLGREYLFEFNDATTLANMSARLNSYVSTWIANRTLSYGEVTVVKSSTSEEAVNLTLNIKFTGTIEVISVDIVIE